MKELTILMRKTLIESLVIDTNSNEKCSNSDNKSYASQCKCVEKLIGCCLISGLYIPAPSKKKYHLDNRRNPKNLSMNTIDQNKDKDIYNWKVEHTLSIENLFMKSSLKKSFSTLLLRSNSLTNEYRLE